MFTKIVKGAKEINQEQREEEEKNKKMKLLKEGCIN